MSLDKFIFVFLLLFSIPVNCQDVQYKVTDQVFFDIQADGQYIGRITIGLFGEEAPKTAKNFKEIAVKGINGKTYRGTKFHRVVKRFLIQGGDIISNNGSGFDSIYGKTFEDENFKIKHNGAGVVSMANKGPNTSGCQFFITTMAAPWLDGHHIAFGRVLKGQEVVHKIEHVKTDVEDRPLRDVIIIKSGRIKNHKPFYENEIAYELTVWAWFKAGWFPLSFSFAILGIFHYIMQQLDNLKSFQ